MLTLTKSKTQVATRLLGGSSTAKEATEIDVSGESQLHGSAEAGPGARRGLKGIL